MAMGGPHATASVVTAAAAAAAAIAAVIALARWAKNVAIMSSALADLKELSVDPPQAKRHGRHAVVVGGSIAGLTTARVLLRYFDVVTVLESEELDVALRGSSSQVRDEASLRIACTPSTRKNVIQFRSNHVVPSLALKVLEALFPDFTGDCMALGARHSHLLHNMDSYFFGIRIPILSRADAMKQGPDLDTVVCSRSVIEGSLRFRLFRDSGYLTSLKDGHECRLHYRPATAANALIAEEGKVKGVQIFDKNSQTSELIEADVVVDASGRSSWGLKWIRTLGINPHIASRRKVVFDPNLLFTDDEAWSQGALEVLETARVKTLATLHKCGTRKEQVRKRSLKYPVGISSEFTGSKQDVIDTAIASLAALKADQIDVYYLHLPNHNTPVEETLEGINELCKSDRFRRFVLTNFDPDEVREVLLGNYSAVARKSEAELFPLLRENNMVFYAYSPVAGCFLTKTREAMMSTSLGRWDPSSLLGENVSELVESPALLDDALRPGSGDVVIVGASKVQQLKDTIAALKKGTLPAGIPV
ncbi:hypothetical protein HK405_007668, partial [Cladochytrium tenue]